MGIDKWVWIKIYTIYIFYLLFNSYSYKKTIIMVTTYMLMVKLNFTAHCLIII